MWRSRCVYMYTNAVLSAAFCAVPSLTTPILCPSSISTRHVSVSQEPSSGVYVVAHCSYAAYLGKINEELCFLSKLRFITSVFFKPNRLRNDFSDHGSRLPECSQELFKIYVVSTMHIFASC
jgi:hypothetical protein